MTSPSSVAAPLIRSLRGNAREDIGILALVAAMVLVITTPPGWAMVGLAAVAVVGLAGNRRLGWIGAGLLLLMTLPFGRGADVSPLQVGSVPVRPGDAVIAVAILGALPSLRFRDRGRVLLAAVAVWLVIGGLAVVVGFVGGNALRDILRDVRWWGLYLAGGVALLAGVRRDQVLRGMLLGLSAFAVLVLIAALAPTFGGGLKDLALQYDRGTLRLQFGNSAYLVPAVAYAVYRLLRSPKPWRIAWLLLLLVAQITSLTRTSIIVTAGVMGLVGLLELMQRRKGSDLLRRGALVAATAALAFVVGVGISTVGTPATHGVDGTGSPEHPLNRVTFTDPQSDITVIVGSVRTRGRFATYLHALRAIEVSPVVGRGQGALVDVAFAYNTSRAYTVGKQPGVDDAYLTAALKAGAIGMAALLAMLLLPLWRSAREGKLRGWFLPGWIGLLLLTVTQSFAVSNYGPFAVSLLAALPFAAYTARRASAARRQV